jgi:hypothetical protein
MDYADKEFLRDAESERFAKGPWPTQILRAIGLIALLVLWLAGPDTIFFPGS